MGTARHYDFDHRYETINGVTKTWGEWCAERGIERSLVYGRVYKGRSFKDAIKNKPKQKPSWWTDTKITISGVTKTPEEWRKERKLSRQCVYQRMHNYGMTVEEALTTEKQRHTGRGLYGEIDRNSEYELSIHPTAEVVEMCTNCKHDDCKGRILTCLQQKRARDEAYEG